MKALSVQTAVHVFRKTEIHPYNPDVLPDWMFEQKETTNRPVHAMAETLEHNITISTSVSPSSEKERATSTAVSTYQTPCDLLPNTM